MNIRTVFSCGLALSLSVTGAGAAPTLVRSGNYGMDGFELRYGGFMWWNTHGVCNGEFPNLAAVEYTGAYTAPTKTIATNCSILTGYFDNPVRDGVYAYYFAGRQLVRKALSAALSDPAQNVATPPFSPTLAVGQLGSALEIHDTTLYFAHYTNTTGANMIYSFDLHGTNVVAEGGFDADSEVAQIQYFDYDDNRVVHALAVLTESGRLYRIKLNPLRTEPAVTLLATSVSYFAIRTGGFNFVAKHVERLIARAAAQVPSRPLQHDRRPASAQDNGGAPPQCDFSDALETAYGSRDDSFGQKKIAGVIVVIAGRRHADEHVLLLRRKGQRALCVLDHFLSLDPSELAPAMSARQWAQ